MSATLDRSRQSRCSAHAQMRPMAPSEVSQTSATRTPTYSVSLVRNNMDGMSQREEKWPFRIDLDGRSPTQRDERRADADHRPNGRARRFRGSRA